MWKVSISDVEGVTIGKAKCGQVWALPLVQQTLHAHSRRQQQWSLAPYTVLLQPLKQLWEQWESTLEKKWRNILNNQFIHSKTLFMLYRVGKIGGWHIFQSKLYVKPTKMPTSPTKNIFFPFRIIFFLLALHKSHLTI